jgi:hypothetical protein
MVLAVQPIAVKAQPSGYLQGYLPQTLHGLHVGHPCKLVTNLINCCAPELILLSSTRWLACAVPT